MKQDTSYKDYVIRGESFQREKNGAWVPQYTVTHQGAATQKMDFPSHQYQFNQAYFTEHEADEFAVLMGTDMDRQALTKVASIQQAPRPGVRWHLLRRYQY